MVRRGADVVVLLAPGLESLQSEVSIIPLRPDLAVNFRRFPPDFLVLLETLLRGLLGVDHHVVALGADALAARVMILLSPGLMARGRPERTPRPSPPP